MTWNEKLFSTRLDGLYTWYLSEQGAVNYAINSNTHICIKGKIH